MVDSKEGVRRIPSTAATQFPDNTRRPFWSFKENSSASDDFFDCYVAFKELHCHEYLWDWQDRKIDELLVKKLMNIYKPFFKTSPIGRDCFITYRVKGQSSLEKLGKLYMAIISSNDFARGNGLFTPPIFEVAHSPTTAKSLVRFAGLYNESVGMAGTNLSRECGPKTVSLLPEHDFSKKNYYTELNNYFAGYQSAFRQKIDCFRPLVPRSSASDILGFVGGVLASKRALSSYASMSKITGISCYPMIEAGPLLFRGGLTPETVDAFIDTYPGARTATISSAFRYDYGLEEVEAAVAVLNKRLPKNSADILTRDDVQKMMKIESVFAKHFASTMKTKPKLGMIAEGLKPSGKEVHTSLRTSFALYSLGVPPEFVGTGRAIIDCIKEGIIGDLERFYPTIKADLIRAGALLNKENLRFLAATHKFWKGVQKDVQLAEDYCGSMLGPSTPEEFIHRNHSSNVFHLRTAKKDFSKDLLAAARMRHCLG